MDFIEDVQWNPEAFDFLVLPSEHKEIIQALVTNKIKGEEQNDIIRGKGNGLFILLHGYVNLPSNRTIPTEHKLMLAEEGQALARL